MTPRFDHLKPTDVAHRLAGALDGPTDRIFNADGGRTGQLDALVDMVAHDVLLFDGETFQLPLGVGVELLTPHGRVDLRDAVEIGGRESEPFPVQILIFRHDAEQAVPPPGLPFERRPPKTKASMGTPE